MVGETSTDIINTLIKIFANYGPPRIIRNDGQRSLTSDQVKEFLSISGVKQQIGTPHNHTAQSHAERAIRSIKELTAKLMNAYKQPIEQWPFFLHQVQLNINSRIHSRINISPFYAVYGHHPHNKPVKQGISLSQTQQEQLSINDWLNNNNQLLQDAHHIIFESRVKQQQADINHLKQTKQAGNPIPIGALVMLKTKVKARADLNYKDYYIVSAEENGYYELQAPFSPQLIMRDRYPLGDLKLIHNNAAEANFKGKNERIVEKILGKKKVTKTTFHYLIKWLGHTVNIGSQQLILLKSQNY